MATKSFITDFPINKNNASKITKALQKSKPMTLQMGKRVADIKKEQLKVFFGKE
jgi:hypothetical protein